MYNSALLVGPDGDVVLHHRKAVLTEEERASGKISAGRPPVGGGSGGGGVGGIGGGGGGGGGVDAPCTSPLPWLGGARVGVLICADIERPEGADACVAAGADLIGVVACTYVPTLWESRSARRQPGGKAEPPAWLGAVAHAARHGVFVAYVNQAKGMGVVHGGSSTDGEGDGKGGDSPLRAQGDAAAQEPAAQEAAALSTLASATCQGGCSRILAPDGRDIVAVPEGAREALVYAVLGRSTRSRLAWSGSALADTLEVTLGSGGAAPSPPPLAVS